MKELVNTIFRKIDNYKGYQMPVDGILMNRMTFDVMMYKNIAGARTVLYGGQIGLRLMGYTVYTTDDLEYGNFKIVLE